MIYKNDRPVLGSTRPGIIYKKAKVSDTFNDDDCIKAS